MNSDFVHSFVTVVDAGSLAGAARRLDITPAAVSARLRALEDELGVALVQRVGRSVRPTEAGLKILERSRLLLRDVRDLCAVASEGTLPGELRLGVFVTALISLLPAILERLYAAYPALAIFVAPGNSVHLSQRVASGDLDAAIVVEPQYALSKNCEWQLLVEEPLVMMAHATVADRHPHELLATEPYIRYDRVALGGQLAERYLRDHQIRPRQRLEIDNSLAIAALVDRGLGVSLLPDWPSLFATGANLRRINLPGRVPVRRVGLLYATHGPCAPLSRALLREARVVFGERSGPSE